MTDEAFENLVRQFKENQAYEKHMLEKAAGVKIFENIVNVEDEPTEEKLYRKVMKK